MAEAFVDLTAEQAALASVALPLGIVPLGSETYGGAIRMTIQGATLDEGQHYQVIVTDEPLKRTFELRLAGAPSA